MNSTKTSEIIKNPVASLNFEGNHRRAKSPISELGGGMNRMLSDLRSAGSSESDLSVKNEVILKDEQEEEKQSSHSRIDHAHNQQRVEVQTHFIQKMRDGSTNAQNLRQNSEAQEIESRKKQIFQSHPSTAFQGQNFEEKKQNIYERLPMFVDDVLYPEYDPQMILYKQEGLILQRYMSQVYGVQYGFDKKGLLEIPLTSRWLRGEEYAFLLRHYKTYNMLCGFTVNHKSQDASVYETPKNGMVYYIKGFHLREFGFPRLKESDEPFSAQKPFKWKKTNFVTDLPKHSPTARYLVAKTQNRPREHFFMHVSILHQEYNPNYKVPIELRKLKDQNKKLFEEDYNPRKEVERIICCHILEKQEDLSGGDAQDVHDDDAQDNSDNEELAEIKQSLKGQQQQNTKRTVNKVKYANKSFIGTKCTGQKYTQHFPANNNPFKKNHTKRRPKTVQKGGSLAKRKRKLEIYSDDDVENSSSDHEPESMIRFSSGSEDEDDIEKQEIIKVTSKDKNGIKEAKPKGAQKQAELVYTNQHHPIIMESFSEESNLSMSSKDQHKDLDYSSSTNIRRSERLSRGQIDLSKIAPSQQANILEKIQRERTTSINSGVKGATSNPSQSLDQIAMPQRRKRQSKQQTKFEVKMMKTQPSQSATLLTNFTGPTQVPQQIPDRSSLYIPDMQRLSFQSQNFQPVHLPNNLHPPLHTYQAPPLQGTQGQYQFMNQIQSHQNIHQQHQMMTNNISQQTAHHHQNILNPHQPNFRKPAILQRYLNGPEYSPENSDDDYESSEDTSNILSLRQIEDFSNHYQNKKEQYVRNFTQNKASMNRHERLNCKFKIIRYENLARHWRDKLEKVMLIKEGGTRGNLANQAVLQINQRPNNCFKPQTVFKSEMEGNGQANDHGEFAQINALIMSKSKTPQAGFQSNKGILVKNQPSSNSFLNPPQYL